MTNTDFIPVTIYTNNVFSAETEEVLKTKAFVFLAVAVMMFVCTGLAWACTPARDVPDLVATKDRKGLSPMDIVAVLTKVVQEKSKVIEEQQQSLEEQKQTIEAQQKVFETFKTEMTEQLAQIQAEVQRLKNKDMTARVVEQE
jgi:TolA-binding protein